MNPRDAEKQGFISGILLCVCIALIAFLLAHLTN
jgi:hypothetical protein